MVFLKVVSLRIGLVVDKLGRVRHVRVLPQDQLLRLDDGVDEDEAVGQYRHNPAYLAPISVISLVINTNRDSILVEASDEISERAHLSVLFSIQIRIFNYSN